MSETNIKSHRDLIVWQKAMNLAQAVYDLTGTFPKEEIYGLTNQTGVALFQFQLIR
ncbi:MAG: four helix bundle protein [Pyrinomonadaceae bacterium]